ncbi:MAG: hypothetical protein HFE30_02405 [Clostridiales bacterium]|nr:hypothetical protein [Clostridiales bacterium]
MARAKKENGTIDEVLRVDGEIRRRENKYYLKIAERYRAAGFLLILLFVIFGAVMLIKYSEYITYDNFVYLLRDLDSVGGEKEGIVSDIKYLSDGNTVFEPFKDGLCVIGGGKVTIYDSTGVELCSAGEKFSSPAVSKSDKYLLVYDLGGTSYSLYNAVTRVCSRKTEMPIISADVSDNGSYAVTYESKEAKYVTEIYNSALVKNMSIYKDKYVVDTALSGSGSCAAIAAVGESGDDISCEVTFCETGKEEPIGSFSYIGAIPLRIESNDDGFVLLCDDAVRFYDNSGKAVSEHNIKGEKSAFFDASGKSCVLVCRENSVGLKNTVYSFDNKGNILYNSLIEMKITGAAAACSTEGAYVGFLSSDGGVTALKSDGESEYESISGEILAVTDMDSGALVCTPTAAYRVFDGKAEK